MRSITVKILLAFAMQANAKELVVNHTSDTQNSMDKLVDNLFNAMLDRAPKVPSIHHENLDETTLGKPVISRTSGASGTGMTTLHGASRQASAGVRLALPPTGAWGHGGVAANLPVSASTGFVQSARMDRGGVVAHGGVVARADSVAEGQEFEVDMPRPIGIEWVRCADGGIYVSKIIEAQADPRVQVGDKLVSVSASFGDEIWPADSYGQCMYAIRTRVGNIYMKILSRGGNTDVFDLEEDNTAFRSERRGGNYGFGTKEVQQQNYMQRKEMTRKREALFNDALETCRKGDYEKACIEFEEVRALEPQGYVGDRFERVTEVYKVSSYNIACCYSKLNKGEPALDALRDALSSGFDDFQKIRTDPNLEILRKEPGYTKLIDSYDEPLISEEAMNALKAIGQNPFKGLFR